MSDWPAVELGIDRRAREVPAPFGRSAEEVKREPGLLNGPGVVDFRGAGEDGPTLDQPVGAVRGLAELRHGSARLALESSAAVFGLDLPVGVPERGGAPRRQGTQLILRPLAPCDLDPDPSHLVGQPTSPGGIGRVNLAVEGFDRRHFSVNDGGGQAMLQGILPRLGFPRDWSWARCFFERSTGSLPGGLH